MSAGWQMVDVAAKCIRTALKTSEFQDSKLAKVGAVLRGELSTLTRLLAHYISGKQGPSNMGGGSSSAKDDDDAAGSALSSDSDAMPSADTESES
jgi:hypothetical protein